MSTESKRRKLWPWIVGGVVVLLVAGGLAAWRWMVGSYHRYYEESYAPVTLTVEHAGRFPDAFHLDDVPWIAASLPVCQSTALQMIAAQHGVEQPRPHFDFLMGFTYGATDMPGVGFFPIGTDPETGMLVAAPYLGLAREYYVTDDGALYLEVLRTLISEGAAVRVPLDMATLYGWAGKLPHNEVLVGYDAGGFYYYETVCLELAPCEPGMRPPGDRGLYVADETLLNAVRGQARQFSYGWRYALTVFVPGPAETALAPVWAQNAEATTGGTYYGKRTGAVAVEELADKVTKQGARFDASKAAPGLKLAATFRRDNAAYLREQFPGQPDIARVADLFCRAADAYQAALEAAEDGIADEDEATEVAAWLRNAAAAEREAGDVMRQRAQ